MTKFKLVGTFGALIVEGSFRDVNIAHSALKAYGIADRKYEIVKVEENSYGLTTDQIDDIYQAVLEQFVEHNSGSDCLSDICSDGFRGLSEYSLDELIDMAEQCEVCHDLVQTYKAKKAIEQEVL